MNRRGLTLIELLVALVTAGIIASVIARTLMLGIRTYRYSARQNDSLTRTRKALMGDGARLGVLAAGRESYSISSIQTSSLALTTPSFSTNYYVTGSKLYRTKSGTTVMQADQVNGLTLAYYLSTNGIISSTTIAASATMVTALVTVSTGAVSAGTYNSYSLYSGAQLRNHP